MLKKKGIAKLVIAIDGPAASGKSTTAKRLAKALNLIYIDSGSMYRTVTLICLEEHIPVTSQEKIILLTKGLQFDFRWGETELEIFVNDRNVTGPIRLPEIDQHVSAYCAIKEVRTILVDKQRQFGKSGGIVMDGRDIGTVVFPQADFKFFLIASVEKRAERRLAELKRRGADLSFSDVLKDLKLRDEKDSNRAHSPLKMAEDAILIDTSEMSIEEQVNLLLAQIQSKLN